MFSYCTNSLLSNVGTEKIQTSPSCKFLSISSCFIVCRLGGAVEDKLSKDQVMQVCFGHSVVVFLLTPLEQNKNEAGTADSLSCEE